MKSKNILILAAVAVLSLGAQSCLKEQNDVFDQTASARMQSALDNAKSILTKPANGWRMEYFAGNSKNDFGGYNMTVSFTDTEVTAGSERNPSLFETTYYRFTNDDGPVISFDTYNSVLHYFATPSSTQYEGMGGDFEFVLLDVQASAVKLKGKRSGKIIMLYPLEEEPEAFLTKMAKAADDFYVGNLAGEIDHSPVTGTFNLNRRQVTFVEQDVEGTVTNTVTTAFIPTVTGIRFYSPVTVAGVEISYLDFDQETSVLSTSDSRVDLLGLVPRNWAPVDAFEGDFTLNYWNGSAHADVKLTLQDDGFTILMSGLSSYYDVVLTYDKAKGGIAWNAQAVGEYQGNTVWMAAWNAGGSGSLTWSTDAGMYGLWDIDTDGEDSEPKTFYFVTNEYTGLTTDSFIFWMTDSDGNSQGQLPAVPGWDPYNRGYIPFLDGNARLVKK